MTARDDETDRLVIDVPASLLRKDGKNEADSQQQGGDFHALARTGANIIEVSRNTEHGVTQVQSLGFATEKERSAALGLLNLPALYDRLPRLYDYLCQMGCGGEREPRYFAALAVSVLAKQLPFADLKARILLPWVNSNNADCMDSAAIALAETLIAGRCEADILALIRHWAKSDNPVLIRVALGALTWRYNSVRSDAALHLIEVTTTTEWMWLLLLPITELFRRIFDADPKRGLRALLLWIEPDRDAPLRLLSALLTLEFLRIEDAVDSEDMRSAAVELVGTLWDDSRLPLHVIVQEQTTEKVKGWAERALALLDQERPALFDPYRQFFLALQMRYLGQRRDRLRFHIERWDRLRDRAAQRRASSRGGDAQSNIPCRSYRELLTPD